MDLNDNIKSIIYKYYTFSKEQISEFTNEWKSNIISTNKLFKIKANDYQNECYICKKKDHFNKECPFFYNSIHIINTIKMRS